MTKIIVDDSSRAWSVLVAAAKRFHLELDMGTDETKALFAAVAYFVRRVDPDEDIVDLIEVVLAEKDEIASWEGDDALRYASVYMSLRKLTASARKPYLDVLALVGKICRHLASGNARAS